MNAQNVGDNTVIDYEGYSLRFTATSIEYAECVVVCSTMPTTAIAIVIPSTVTIEGMVFAVTSIGEYAFHECSSLTSVLCLAEKVPYIYAYPFDGCPNSMTIYIPRESVNNYQADSYWNNFTIRSLTYDVAAVTNPKEAGAVTGIGTYSIKENVTLIAKANENYRFLNWTENGEVISEDAEYMFVASEI